MALRTIVLKVPTGAVGNVLDAVERITGVQIELPITTTVHREVTAPKGNCDRILQLLNKAPATATQLARALNIQPSSVYGALNRLKERRLALSSQGVWHPAVPPVTPAKKAAKAKKGGIK